MFSIHQINSPRVLVPEFGEANNQLQLPVRKLQLPLAKESDEALGIRKGSFSGPGGVQGEGVEPWGTLEDSVWEDWGTEQGRLGESPLPVDRILVGILGKIVEKDPCW